MVGARASAADESMEALIERIRGASLIVEGETGRPYTGWDGSDRATVRTYTPFRIDTVLKGQLSDHDIVLRQPGGDVDGSAVGIGAAFDAGERLIVFLGERDAADNSYVIPAQMEGAFRVTQDSSGGYGIDVRLGADASAYSNREKAPGTLLTRISVDRFERLARSMPDGGNRASAGDAPERGQRLRAERVASLEAKPRPTNPTWLVWACGVCGLALVGVWWRTRSRQ